DLFGAQATGTLSPALSRRELSLQSLQVRRNLGDIYGATLVQVYATGYSRSDADDLIDGVIAIGLKFLHHSIAMPGGDFRAASRDDCCQVSRVSAGRPESHVLLFDHDDGQLRVSELEVVGGPQPGHACTNHADVYGRVADQGL